MKWMFFAGGLLLGGCINGFDKYYKPSPNADQVVKSPYNAPVAATPLIYDYSNDPKVDNHNVQRAGYVYVGSASFYANARKVSQSQAVSEAKKRGASLVLVHTTYKDTISGSVPFTVPNAWRNYRRVTYFVLHR
jgi:pyruvate/2-oxoacid:ferredoxin oxidoreductase beta subunit